jgi:exosortase K
MDRIVARGRGFRGLGFETQAARVLKLDQKLVHDAGAIAVMLGITYSLKLHYSNADAEALAWILAPTAWLVEMLVGAPFVAERGVGYVNTGLRFAIAPSCAGVNFMIIAICTATIGFVARRQTILGKLGFVLGCVPVAYVATLGVNTLRIVIALFLQGHSIQVGGLSPAEIHHTSGVLVYFTCLCVLYVLGERLLRRKLAA